MPLPSTWGSVSTTVNSSAFSQDHQNLSCQGRMRCVWEGCLVEKYVCWDMVGRLGGGVSTDV